MAEFSFPVRPGFKPMIYAYTDKLYPRLLKVGYTAIDVKKRVAQQYPTVRPGEKPYTIVYSEAAIREDGTTFMDYEVHRYLRSNNIENPDGEWFRCDVSDVAAAVLAIKQGIVNYENRTKSFGLRPEQEAAISQTQAYYDMCHKLNNGKIPRFLWNAKMRFGKTFATYQLAKRMEFSKILILTFKPAVQSAWYEDLTTHIDFEGWQFISKNSILSVDDLDMSRPVVCFGSFQDFLGKNAAGGIKAKNEWVHTINWDLVVFDEYHYGAWRDNAKELFEAEDKAEQTYGEGEGISYFNEDFMPITTSHYLYLSGTPFRAIATGEFIEEQIYNWTYSDEQKAKIEWQGEDNPYASLPRMVLMTYQLPDSIRDIAVNTEFNEFDLNLFFTAIGEGDEAVFKYENEVQKWLDMIRGGNIEMAVDNLKLGGKKPPIPFNDVRLLAVLTHTLWYLPSVSACYAMRNLLGKRQNVFYHDYKINVAAGASAGIGVEALEPVLKSMNNPLESKTITLTCGKLTTGVTVKPWTGIFMLRNLSSPESYFQAAFRVQSPWVIDNPDGDDPSKKAIMKKECYVFDFAPNRALRQIVDYSCRLSLEEDNPEKKVQEFINFLPVLAYDGSSMRAVDAAGILDITTAGTTATLLAKRWESALLVNVDTDTLERLLYSEAAMEALRNIEGFRSLNQDLETIINLSKSIKDKKKDTSNTKPTKEDKKQLSEEEKEYKSKRKEIQEKLMKFATRIPVFMYLTDEREQTLKDIITQLEPGLFKKVTGLEVNDFELLVSLGVFNDALMNDAVYKFKRYEDSSLSYSGIDMHEGETIGLFDTTISRDEFIEGI